jgi:hypothetical protein
VNIEPKSAAKEYSVLKVSWDLKDLNNHSIHDKLQDHDHDPYFQKMAEGAYIFVPRVSTSMEVVMERICSLLVTTAVNLSNAHQSGTIKPILEEHCDGHG